LSCIGDEKVHSWAIALIVIFVLITIGLIVFGIIIYRRRCSQKQYDEEDNIAPLTFRSSVLVPGGDDDQVYEARKSNRK
jgi:hypothetical protein